MDLKPVLDSLRRSYRGIDLRALLVALGDGSPWQALFCVVRLTNKGPGEIAREHKEIIKANHLRPAFLTQSFQDPKTNAFFRGLNLEFAAHPIEC